MKLIEITKTIYGQNNLNCLVSIEKTCNGIYFNDMTKNVCIKIENQKQLDLILENNKF